MEAGGWAISIFTPTLAPGRKRHVTRELPFEVRLPSAQATPPGPQLPPAIELAAGFFGRNSVSLLQSLMPRDEELFTAVFKIYICRVLPPTFQGRSSLC